MKKNIITIVVAMLYINIANADTTLYGSLRQSVEWTNIDRSSIIDVETGERLESVKDSTIDVVSNSSRFGIKGNENLGNNMEAIYLIEFGIRGDVGGILDKNRLAFAGLKSDYGTILIGKQWSPYYNALNYNDIFNSSASYRLYQGTFRLADMVHYISPEYYGLKLSGAFVFGTGADSDEVITGLRDQDQIDTWNVTAEWNYKGFDVGLSYLESADDNGQLVGAGIGYKNDLFRLGFMFEGNLDGVSLYSINHQVPALQASDDDSFHYNVSGEYYITDTDTFRAGVSFLDQSSAGDAQQYLLGLEHKFSKRTLTWLEYSYATSNELELLRDSNDIMTNDTKDHMISLGFRHDF